MADDQEVIIRISTEEDLSGVETLDDLVERLRDKASDIPIDFDESDAQNDVDGLTDSLEGLSMLAVGEALQDYGSSAEAMAQQMNEAAISVGQLAIQTGIAEPEMVNLINDISNATFPNEEAMMYVKSLDQIGVSTDKLGQSATDLDAINDAFGLGAQRTNSMGQELSVLGVDMENVSSSFNALAYANSNTVGGMENFYTFLRKYDAQFKELGLDVDQSAIIIAAATQKYGGGRAALTGLSDALKDADGDTRALEEALGLQAGTLDHASDVTGKYEGQLDDLASEEGEHKTLLDQLGAAWDDLSLSLGSVASPILSVLGLGGQVAGFGSQMNGTLELLKKFGNFEGFGSLTSGLSGLVSEIPLVGGALSSLSLGPVALIIAALVALAIAIYEVGKAFGWWTDVGTMFEAIKAGVLALWDAFINNQYVVQIIDLIKSGLMDAWNAIVGFGQAIMSALGDSSGEFDILAWAINGLQTVLSVVGPIAVMYIQSMISAFQQVYLAAQYAWPYVSNAIQTAMSVAGSVINSAKGVFNGLVQVFNTVSSTVQGMASVINSALSAASSAWSSFSSAVMSAVQPVLDAIGQIQSAGGAILSAIGFGGVETPIVTSGGSYGGSSTMVSQGNTIIFNMYGDIKDEKTLDDTINAINDRIQYEALSNGTTINNNGSGAI